MNTDSVLDIQKVAQVLKLLGDKTRLMMMKLLQSHECCVCEFVELFQTSQPAISQHLRKLKDAGLVQETRRGQWVFYSMRRDHEYTALVESLLNHFPDQYGQLADLEKKGLRISCK